MGFWDHDSSKIFILHVQSELFLSRFAWSILVADRLRTLGRSASFEQPAQLSSAQSRPGRKATIVVNILLIYG
jgi:hypothetical protein